MDKYHDQASKRAHAIVIRNQALIVVQALGVWEEMKGGPKVRVFDNPDFQIAYYNDPALPMLGLDIWRHWIEADAIPTKRRTTKVFSIRWKNADVSVITFRAGWLRWEERLRELQQLATDE
jgi:hypothetical protein